ncbi:hypothetical protein HK102_012514, partial [Quaeritorhiza haematococci]
MAFTKLAHKNRRGLFVRTNAQVDNLKSSLKYTEEYMRFAAPYVPNLKDTIADAIQTTLVLRSNSYFKDSKGLARWLEETERKLQNADLIASYIDPDEDRRQDHRDGKDIDWNLVPRGVVDLILKNKRALIRWARRFRVKWNQEEEEDDLTISYRAGFRHAPKQAPVND